MACVGLSGPADEEEAQGKEERVIASWGWEWFLGTAKGQVTFMVGFACFLILTGALCWMTTEGTPDYKNNFEEVTLDLIQRNFSTGIALVCPVPCRFFARLFHSASLLLSRPSGFRGEFSLIQAHRRVWLQTVMSKCNLWPFFFPWLVSSLT